MAKRKRLTPAQPDYLDDSAVSETKSLLRAGLASGAAPPIAQVAGDASAIAALQEVSEVLAAARAEGRLLQRLSLDTIEVGYLIRDRLEVEEEGLGHLIESIRLNGQRSPVEVAEIAPGVFGLISGFRRMAALKRLHEETGEPQFGVVLALIRRPDTAEDAYVAMVEENEVRLGLSYYERARIAAKAVEQGVFTTEKAALQRLFSAASRSRRSKIGSFLAIYHELDTALRFPAALPERLGLALAKLIEQAPDHVALLREDLIRSAAKTADEELALLAQAVENQALSAVLEPVLDTNASAPPVAPAPQGIKARSTGEEIRPGVFLKIEGPAQKPQFTLSGPNLGPEFHARLLAWLSKG